MDRRVVVTGIGTISPFGIGKDILWQGLLEGRAVAGPITSFDSTRHDVHFACSVRDFNPEDHLTKKEARRLDRFLQFSVAAAKLALDDSGLEVTDANADQVGVLIGSGIGGMTTLEEQHAVIREKGPSKVSPFFIPMMIANMASGQVAIKYGMKGPNLSIVTACATGAHSIGEAAELIKARRANAMVAGGTESAITALAIAGFCSMRALSTRNDNPNQASRPFDRERDGFVMGEGAGVVVLEELEHAKQRGAHIYGEVTGFGMSADAHHITDPDPVGAGAVSAMRQAIDRSGITPDRIQYINAHGTSTPAGDKAEIQAIKTVFGDHATRLAVSSTKSMMGHTLGAAGALETIVCLLTVERGLIPPTINYDYPDPECDLDFVPNIARETPVEYAMNNSFGFGGQNAVLVVRRYKNGS